MATFARGNTPSSIPFSEILKVVIKQKIMLINHIEKCETHRLWLVTWKYKQKKIEKKSTIYIYIYIYIFFFKPINYFYILFQNHLIYFNFFI